MKGPLTLSILVLPAVGLFAQCEGLPIPPTTSVISTSGSYGIMAGTVWVCSGVDAVITAMSGITVFTESNVTLTVVGNNCIGYAKQPANISVIGDTCFWSYEPGVLYMGNGVINFGSTCTPFSYDYSQAPANGCAVNSVTDIELPAVDVDVLPNPAQDHLAVRTTNAVLCAVDVLDLSGRELQHAFNAHARLLDVHALQPGNYLLRVRTDRGTCVRRFMKD